MLLKSRLPSNIDSVSAEKPKTPWPEESCRPRTTRRCAKTSRYSRRKRAVRPSQVVQGWVVPVLFLYACPFRPFHQFLPRLAALQRLLGRTRTVAQRFGRAGDV